MATKLKISKEMYSNTKPIYYVELVTDNFYHDVILSFWNLKQARKALKNIVRQKTLYIGG
jgi:hypothetical protein